MVKMYAKIGHLLVYYSYPLPHLIIFAAYLHILNASGNY